MTVDRQIELIGITDVGCVRSGNEDCFMIQEVGCAKEVLNPPEVFEVSGAVDVFTSVSDGMGGAAAGELASQTALTTLLDYLQDQATTLMDSPDKVVVKLIEEGVHTANREIYRKAQEVAGSRGMGATITAAYLKGDVLYLFQIGDSRAYVLRDERLYQITRDQSFVGHLVEMGTITEEQAMRHPQRNVILQALGTQDKLNVDVSYLPLCIGDLVLLCSDGLSGEFMPDQLEKLANQSAKQGLGFCIQHLVEEAKKAGGKDNITLVGLSVKHGLPERDPGQTPGYMPYASQNRGRSLFG